MLMGQIKLLVVSVIFIITISSFFSKQGSSKNSDRSDYFTNETYVQEITDIVAFNQTQPTYFLLIYSLSCGHCKKFQPIYNKASVKARNAGWSNVIFAKINAPKVGNVEKYFKYKTFPTIYWVNNLENEVVEYEGSKTSDSMVNFINNMLNITSEEATNYESIKMMISHTKGKHLVFIGDMEIPSIQMQFRKFFKLAREEEYESVYWSKSPELFQKFSIPENEFDAVVFTVANKTVDPGTPMKLSPAMSRQTIEKYLSIFARKLWGKLGEEEIEDAIDESAVTPTMFIVYDKNSTNDPDLGNMFERLAEKYQLDYWFLNTTYDSPYSFVFKEVFKVTEEKLPFLVMVENNPNNIDDVDKYLYPAIPVNEANIEKFIDDFKHKKLEKFIYSEKPPQVEKDANGIVRVVGSTFDDIVVNNPGKDVLLVLCIESSKRCKFLNERIAHVAKKLTTSNPQFIMARIETSFNEIKYIHYHSIPSIAFIPGFDTKEERISNIKIYEGELTTAGIVKFAKQYAKTPLNVVILENEETIFKDEKKKIIKQADKDKEEEISNLEDEVSTGLRRTVISEVEREDFEDDEDSEEDNHVFDNMKHPPRAGMKKNEDEKKKRKKREEL